MEDQAKHGEVTNNLYEHQLVDFWQHLILARTVLTTDSGETIRIVYPGRINHDRGADFCDAVIATSDGVLKGDIEIHVKSGDWQAHRHHQNPDYNRVILHVIMEHNTKAVTNSRNGSNILTLALDRYITDFASPGYPLSQIYSPTTSIAGCHNSKRSLSADIIADFLDRAGDERFMAKVSQFHAGINQTGAAQFLYGSIMAALGYAHNKLPFLELARRLPLQILESPTQNMSDGEYLVQQQALLLGTAGLLSSQHYHCPRHSKLGDRWLDSLERVWACYHPSEVISPISWDWFRVRPNNSPVRRLIAMSYLILRYRGTGMFSGMVNMTKEALLKKSYHKLEAGLMVTASGYWFHHSDFGSTGRSESQSLLGRNRAAEITVNVLFPFIFAWSRFHSGMELGQRSLELYHSYPRLASNTFEQHMTKQLGLSSRLVNSARRQQGLIHIYEALCTQGKCNACPLS